MVYLKRLETNQTTHAHTDPLVCNNIGQMSLTFLLQDNIPIWFATNQMQYDAQFMITLIKYSKAFQLKSERTGERAREGEIPQNYYLNCHLANVFFMYRLDINCVLVYCRLPYERNVSSAKTQRFVVNRHNVRFHRIKFTNANEAWPHFNDAAISTSELDNNLN